MPYQEANDISLKANQIIYTSINNNFQKMVNNDLYIQKKLLEKSNYTEGPKLSTHSSVKNGANGYKVWNPNIQDPDVDKISILQKVEKELLSTLTQTECETTPVVNCIADDKNYGLVAGAQDGLYKIDNSFKNATRVEKDVGSVRSYTKDEEGNTLIGTSNGLWNLSTSDEQIIKISEKTDTNYIYNLSGDILRTTNNGIYRCDYDGYKLKDQSKIPNINEKTNSIVGKNKDLIAATDSGIYQGQQAYTITQTGEPITVSGNIKKLLKLNNILFVWSDTGLSTVIDTTVKKLIDSTNINQVRIIDKDLFVAIGGSSSQKGIWKYNNSSSSIEQTEIKIASYDIYKQWKKYFIGTSKGIVYSEDLTSYSLIEGSSTDQNRFATIGEYLYFSDSTQNLKKIVPYSYDSIEVQLSEEILDIIRTRDESFIVTKNSIYDGNLKNLLDFEEPISWCHLTTITNTSLNGVYAFTDKGIFFCDKNGTGKKSDLILKDVKTTIINMFKVDSENKLYYTYDVMKSFWDETIVWKEMCDNVQQIETMGGSAYFLSDGKLLIQNPQTKASITHKFDITNNVQNFKDFDIIGDDTGIVNAYAFYFGENKTYMLSNDLSTSVELKTLSSSKNITDQIIKSYMNNDVCCVFINGSYPRMPVIKDGVSLRDYRNYREVIQINGDTIDSLILSDCHVIDGVVASKKTYPHSGETFKQVLQYKNSNLSNGFQDDNYTFFTSTNGSTNRLRYTRPKRVNDTYLNSYSSAPPIVAYNYLPLPDLLSNIYLIKFQPEIFAYTSHSNVFFAKHNEEGVRKDAELSSIVSDINTGAYIGYCEDKNWDISTKKMNIPGVEPYYANFCVKGIYHIFENKIYKSYYTIIARENEGGYYSYNTYILSSKITTYEITKQPEQYQKAVCIQQFNTSTTPVKLDKNYSRLIENGDKTYLTKESTLYVTNTKISDITTETKWNIKSGVTGGHMYDISHDRCFYIKNSTSDTNFYYRTNINGTPSNENKENVGFVPTALRSFILNGLDVVIVYNDTKATCITASSISKNPIPIEDGAEIIKVYNSPRCNENRVCITDSNKNIYELRYNDSEVSIEKKKAIVEKGYSQIYQFDDPKYMYCGPKFDVMTDTSGIYINSYQFEYTDSYLSNMITSTNDVKAFTTYDESLSDTILYVSNGKKLKRKIIDHTNLFDNQVSDFIGWDKFDDIWNDGEYKFDDDINTVLTAIVPTGLYKAKRSIIVLTNNNILYRSDYDLEKKVYDPEKYGENFKEEIEKLGLTINSMANVNGELILNTNKGTYGVDVDYSLIIAKDTEYSNIIKLVKLEDPEWDEFFAIKRSTDNNFFGYNGRTTTLEFKAFGENVINNIHFGDTCYYVFSENGISSISGVNDTNLKVYDERLSGVSANYLISDNKFQLSNGINSLITNNTFKLSGGFDIGITPDDMYQYDKRQVYINKGEQLYTTGATGPAEPVYYKGTSETNLVKNEYENFKFVRNGNGLYNNGNELYRTDYTDKIDCFCDNYLKYGTNQVHTFEVLDTYVMNLSAVSSKNPFKLININDIILVACDDGWYVYQDGILTKVIDCTLPNKRAPFAINKSNVNKFTGKIEEQYIFVLNGNEVYSFKPTTLKFEKLFTFNKGNVTEITVQNNYKYLFATESNGIWYTYYDYEMKDFIEFPEKSEITEKVNEIYDLSISNHIEEYHKDNGDTKSIVKYINENLISPDFSGISNSWKKQNKTTDNFIVVENDIVESIILSSVQDPISVQVSNFSTENEYSDVSGVTFIYKKWTSGQKELFVNIPSTNTYYNPHLGGIPYCINYDNSTYENRTLSSDATTIKVTIQRKYFDNIRNFSDIMIEGQSLPLKIYKDSTYDCHNSQNYFHSVIKKSVFHKKVHEEKNIILYFKCFGTDGQALKLIGF